jgi:hypothetical protein
MGLPNVTSALASTRTPVLVVDDDPAEWALAAGCDAFVRKGASAGVLVRELRRLEGFAV